MVASLCLCGSKAFDSTTKAQRRGEKIDSEELSCKIRDAMPLETLMMSAVLTLLWRDVAGVRELTRILARDGFLWCNPAKVR
ncbi:hypothetical protein [Anabaena sp. UHCC 0399]|uniref:hypothetical protein n=1 Tax=Anabaena sp. UHCC 0399 TaxID=3110238 RepID=UPI002B21B7CC|nr:hypothetical protein [Anabaena sp. UHCC 0399]MEA5563962.1 hypothetical protein [Anabaena sp. UHCC 0399]